MTFNRLATERIRSGLLYDVIAGLDPAIFLRASTSTAPNSIVIPGLGPGIHAFLSCEGVETKSQAPRRSRRHARRHRREPLTASLPAE